MTGRGHELGAQFEAELIASVRVLFGDLAADRCKIPDEKRVRAPDGSRAYFGELRVADLQIILPKRRTVYVEAKATSRSAPIATVRTRQWETLRFLAERGHESWLLLNWRTLEPPFVNECFAIPADIALMREGKSIPAPWAREFGEPVCRLAARSVRDGWGWDLRAITAYQGGR